MTAVYLYGIARAAEETEVQAPGVGADKEGVRRVVHGELAALVSDVEPGPLVAARGLRAHWRVLEEAASKATVLPVRFGTVMESEGAVVDRFLAPRHDHLVAQLAGLSGKVQLSVKAFYDEDRLMRGVLQGSPAVAQLRERVRGRPKAATYYDRIQLGELVAGEVDRARERDSAMVFDRARAACGGRAARAARHSRRRRERRLPRRALPRRRVQRGRGAPRGRGRGTDAFALRRPAAAVQLHGGAGGGWHVGLITGLLTLPLAPVRGTVWLAERIQEQAEAELYDEDAIRAQLMDIDAAREAGEIGEEEATQAEDELLERLIAVRGNGGR